MMGGFWFVFCKKSALPFWMAHCLTFRAVLIFFPAVLCLLNGPVGTGAAGDPKNRKRFGANGACGTGSI
jgi:hypothetical protein